MATATLTRVETRRISPWRRTLRNCLAQGQMRVGLVLTAAVVIIAVVGPLVAPYSPTELVGPPFNAPADGAPLGTDGLGRDVLSRVLSGGGSLVWMSVAATGMGVGLGLIVGLVAGYGSRIVDELLMRSTDVVLAFPQIVLALLFVSVLGPQKWLIIVVVAVSHAPRVARLVRGLTLEVVRREFVEAAEVIGIPRHRILSREVLPHLITPLMVEFGLRLTWSVGIIAGLSYLGAGLQPPSSDWGLMISGNQEGLILQPWAVIAPIVCLAVFAVGTNLMTEGIARAVAGVDRKVSPR